MNGPRWIKQWIADLALLNEQFRNDDGSVDFEALGREEYMFRTALITQKLDKSERARETFMTAKAAYDVSSENGKKGGRPRKNSSEQDEALVNQPREGAAPELRREEHSAATSRTLPLPSWEEFLSYVDGEGLDYTDAREWWEMTMVDREGKDRDGKPIRNWKGALKRFCTTKTANRRNA